MIIYFTAIETQICQFIPLAGMACMGVPFVHTGDGAAQSV